MEAVLQTLLRLKKIAIIMHDCQLFGHLSDPECLKRDAKINQNQYKNKSDDVLWPDTEKLFSINRLVIYFNEFQVSE